MPRDCSPCSHARTAEISKNLLAGDSIRLVAARFDLSPASVGRHLRNCLRVNRSVEKPRSASAPIKISGASRFASDSGPIDSPAALLNRLEKLLRVGALLDDALDRGDVDAVCKLAREYRATVESYGKIAGWTADGSGSTTIINDNRRVMAVLGKMSDDEIRAALLGAETPELDAAIEASSPPILPP